MGRIINLRISKKKKFMTVEVSLLLKTSRRDCQKITFKIHLVQIDDVLDTYLIYIQKFLGTPQLTKLCRT